MRILIWIALKIGGFCAWIIDRHATGIPVPEQEMLDWKNHVEGAIANQKKENEK